jgi:hypothetical protein
MSCCPHRLHREEHERGGAVRTFLFLPDGRQYIHTTIIGLFQKIISGTIAAEEASQYMYSDQTARINTCRIQDYITSKPLQASKKT